MRWTEGLAWPVDAPSVAVALSGGPDSLALALLAADWAKAHDIPLTTLTVDHRLRPESAAEAAQVAAWMAARSIPHQILTWNAPKPTANLQAAARQARYDLLTGWCRSHSVPVLLLGHHADDQIETFLLRLARGSGLRGLSAMQPDTVCNGIRLVRPLLDIPKQTLRDYLGSLGQPWLEDPSNTDPRFDRSRMRSLAATLPEAGIPAARVLLAIRNLQRANAAIEAMVAERLQKTCTFHPEGFATLTPAAVATPDEVALRTLAAVLQTVGGRAQTGRLAALEGLLTALRQDDATPRTLQGCLAHRNPQTEDILFWREPAAVAPPALAVDGMLWDNRFRIQLNGCETATDIWIGALGTAGWQQIEARCRKQKRLAAVVRLTLPALWQQGRVLAVPQLGWAAHGWEGRYQAVFQPFADPTIFKPPALTYS
jgi:tRNA(Ile)-lysidine synthase